MKVEFAMGDVEYPVDEREDEFMEYLRTEAPDAKNLLRRRPKKTFTSSSY